MCLFLALQELEATLIYKYHFLWEEHGRMEWEAAMSRRIDELERQLESARCESQDRAAKTIGARAVELLAVEWATTTERGLDTAKVHQAEIEVAI